MSVVYVAVQKDGVGRRVKIGWTSNLVSRMRALHAHALVSFPGDRSVEAELHRECSDDRISGDWFWHTQAVVDAYTCAALNAGEEYGFEAIVYPSEEVAE